VATGDVAITGSGNLQKSHGILYIIHAVGPIWEGGTHNEEQLLKDCVIGCLNKYVLSHKYKKVSIPAISSGIFGFPKEKCAKIMIDTSVEEAEKGSSLEEIRLTNFDELTVGIFKEEMERKIKSLEEKKEDDQRRAEKENIEKEQKMEEDQRRAEKENIEKEQKILNLEKKEHQIQNLEKKEENNKDIKKQDQKKTKERDCFCGLI